MTPTAQRWTRPVPAWAVTVALPSLGDVRRDFSRLSSPYTAMVRRAQSAVRKKWRGRGISLLSHQGQPA